MRRNCPLKNESTRPDLPLVVGLGFWILKPEYIRLLYTDETGQKFLTYAIISEIVGILVIRKIANPRF